MSLRVNPECELFLDSAQHRTCMLFSRGCHGSGQPLRGPGHMPHRRGLAKASTICSSSFYQEKRPAREMGSDMCPVNPDDCEHSAAWHHPLQHRDQRLWEGWGMAIRDGPLGSQSALGLLVRWLGAQCIEAPSLATPRSALAGRLEIGNSRWASLNGRRRWAFWSDGCEHRAVWYHHSQCRDQRLREGWWVATRNGPL